MSSAEPLVFDILEGLLRKSETVRCSFQVGNGRVEGTLLKMEVIEEMHAIRGRWNNGGRGVRFYYDFLGDESTSVPLDFLMVEIEEHSNLKKIDVGWQLIVNHMQVPK